MSDGRITEMWAFVVVDPADGQERIPTFFADEAHLLPMVGSDSRHIDALRPAAEALAAQMELPMELIRFTVRESIEVIGP